jgi:hypothetical protein
MTQLTAGFTLRDNTYVLESADKFKTENAFECLYFDSCFFLHGTASQLRRFAQLILSQLPPEPPQATEPTTKLKPEVAVYQKEDAWYANMYGFQKDLGPFSTKEEAQDAFSRESEKISSGS